MGKIRCYYDVLEIARTATGDEIKKAYRKQALIWHPDKNQHQLELADEKFKEVNTAYTTLSDANERKWYDDHRDAILRGGDDDSSHINLWTYFSTTCYDGYEDGERGFYTVYSKIFEDIYNEEIEADDDFSAYSKASNSKVKERSAPMFGRSDSGPNDVMKFYQYWRNFVTKKKFSMADKYNTNEAPNRQIKRLMEKENQKERSYAKQEYQDQVRHLVEFIYKRDRRVIEHLKKLRAEEDERLKREEEERIKRDEEHKEAMRLHRQQQQEEYERQKREGVIFMEDEEDYQEVPNFYCIVCEKKFSSKRSFANHEQSNIHKKRLENLKKAVSIDGLDNDIQLEIPSDISDSEVVKENVCDLYKRYDTNKEEEDSDYDEPHGIVKKNNKKNKKKQQQQKSDDEDEEDTATTTTSTTNNTKGKNNKKNNKKKNKKDDSDDDDIDVPGMVKKGKNNKKNNKNSIELEDKEEVEDEEEEEVVEIVKTKKKSKKDKKKKNVIRLTTESDEEDEEIAVSSKNNEDEEDDDDDEDEVDIKSLQKSLKKNKFLDSDSEDDKKSQQQPKKIGKAKEKRLQREEKKKQAATSTGTSMKCNVCSDSFSTRNKLFQHIKETGHSLHK